QILTRVGIVLIAVGIIELNYVGSKKCERANQYSSKPLLSPFATAIEIAATQTKSACADWVI
ncbi:MAG: hypothetical protein ACLFWI_28740, partial [Coleofasciculus sp.]|uniref:hypothetical protein n=1 Tax=Coleofasciculus sp. TaxID=3100458 RepID=UPI003A370411